MRRLRRRLFRKYAAVLVLLVAGALLASGLVQTYIEYGQSRAARAELQQEKARSAATRIELFLSDVERQLEAAAAPRGSNLPKEPDQRRAEYLRLLALVPAITTVSYLDPAGREQMRVSRIALDRAGPGADRRDEQAFREPAAGRTYFGPVRFEGGSEPYMTVAVPEGGPEGGVVAAEVNLKFVREVVAQIRFGRTGGGYVVDRSGQLIAHPDIGLVLRRTDLSALPQVRAALPGGTAGKAPSARGPDGRAVLSSHQPVDAAGWLVFVEQPLDEALAPVYAGVLGQAGLTLIGIGVSVLAGLFLARRMATPIGALQAGAARIGTGAFGHRLELHTGDELEAVADEFNRMAARLQASYADLEQRIEARTRELRAALEQETATAGENVRLLREVQEKNRQLELASQHKSAFLASVSHELRTPLHAVIGFTEVLLDPPTPLDAARQRRFLEHVLGSARHLLTLINDILDIAKIEAGRLELYPEPIDVADAGAGVHAVVRPLVEKKRQQLTLDLAPDVGTVHHDPARFKQVLYNLLANASKFTPEGGAIRTAIRRRAATEEYPGWLEVAVSDTGIGIAPEDQARIFEEFTQLDAGYARQQQGTGLGLALARRFVYLMGGEITVESASGAGATFTVVLPAAAPAAAPPARPPAAISVA